MNTPESTDSSGRGADPYRRDPYESQSSGGPYEPGAYETDQGAYAGATDLLDYPALPPFPEGAFPGGESAAIGTPLGGGDDGTGNDGGGNASGLRVSSDAEATARLLIKLPPSPPQPSTTLRPHAAWEDRDPGVALPDGAPGPRLGAVPATAFAQVAASPARPSALPSELAALTTATLVVPLPRASRPTPALLTTTLPPDKAAQANAAALADAFHDTLEQVFGLDLDTVSAADVGLESQAPQAAQAGELEADLPGDWFRDETGAGLAVGPHDLATLFDGTGAHSGAADTEVLDVEFADTEFVDVDQASYEYVPGVVPAATFGGPYGAPTQPAAFPGFGAHDPYTHDSYTHDPARHALSLRYLGGIFHDSSGESSYLDPGSYAARALLASASVLTAPVEPSAAPDAPTEQFTRIPAQSNGTRAARRPPAGTATPDRFSPVEEGVAAHDDAPAADHRRGGSRLLTVVVMLAAGFAFLYGVALVMAGGVFGGKLPRGTDVDGVPVGGMSPAAAERVIATQLADRSRRPLPVLIGQTPTTIDPAAAGLSLDAAATVRAAQKDRTNPLVVIPALFGGTHEVSPVSAVDVAALTRALSGVAASYNSPMVEGAITFDHGVPVVTAPKEGRGFSIPGAVDAVRSGYLNVDGTIRIPVRTLSPRADPAALQAALEQLARPAVSGPITLVTGAATTRLTPTQIGDAVAISPDAGGRMVAHVDGTRLRGYLGTNVLAQEQQATNASFSITDGRPTLIPARDGRGFAPDALSAAVLPVLTQTSPRTATVPIGDLSAAFSTADAQALGVTDVLGSSTLPVTEALNRFANVQRAVSLIAGDIVQPADTWSFLKSVGAPTGANGFAVSAAAQHKGVDPSDGVDTVATAVFGAAFASGMGDTMHHPHASYVDRYPVGLDAAVVAPGTDLQWTNTGDHPVYLYASYANDALTVALLGERQYDAVNVQVSQRTAIVQPSRPAGSSCTQGSAAGFQVDVTRTLLRDGSQVGAEQYHVTYLPQSGDGCVGGGSSPTQPGTGVTAGPTKSPSASSGSGGGAGGGVGGGAPPPSAAPSPSPTGILGGLLH